MWYVSLFDFVVLCVSMLFEVHIILLQAQEPILQLLPGHTGDILTVPSILKHWRICHQQGHSQRMLLFKGRS